MIFHENRLLADDSHEISFLIFFGKQGKMLQHLSSAAVVIVALRVKIRLQDQLYLISGIVIFLPYGPDYSLPLV